MLALPEDMTIGNISECKKLLQNSLKKVTALTIDSSTLKQIDSAGVQLLLILTQEAERQSISLQWCHKNTVLEDIKNKLGFEHFFMNTQSEDLNLAGVN